MPVLVLKVVILIFLFDCWTKGSTVLSKFAFDDWFALLTQVDFIVRYLVIFVFFFFIVLFDVVIHAHQLVTWEFE